MPIQFSRTGIPSTVIGFDLENGQFFHAHTRTRALLGQAQIELAAAVLNDVVELDRKAQALPAKFGPAHYVKLRSLFIDDKSGDITLRVDYLHDQGELPAYTEKEIKLFLHDGIVRHFGQGQWVEASIKPALFSSDYFSPVADEYYKNEF